MSYIYIRTGPIFVGRDSADGIAIRYALNGPGIESRWGRDFPHPSSEVLEIIHPPVWRFPGLFAGNKAGGSWRWPPKFIHPIGWPETSSPRNNPEERSSQEFKLPEISESIQTYIAVNSIHREGPTILLSNRRSGNTVQDRRLRHRINFQSITFISRLHDLHLRFF
jgi:hypothetical protein